MRRFPAIFSVILLLVLSSVAKTSAQQTLPKVDFAKKIAEATPPALPQSPVPKTIGNDLRDRGFKGNVKRVVTSSATLAVPEPTIESEQEYDSTGKLTKSGTYYAGFPHEVTVYGFIDGQSVSRSKLVTYTVGERPAFKIGGSVDPPRDRAAPKDERYDTRVVTEYDLMGRVVKSTAYLNNGEESFRMTVVYTKGRREKRLYYGGADPRYVRDSYITTTVDFFDEHGNTLEQWRPDSKTESKLFFTYQFDTKGNWITMNTLKPEIVDGKESLKLLRTTSRTIDTKGNWITMNTLEPETVDGKESLKLLRASFRTIIYY
jgi:hypothetical protein